LVGDLFAIVGSGGREEPKVKHFASFSFGQSGRVAGKEWGNVGISKKPNPNPLELGRGKGAGESV